MDLLKSPSLIRTLVGQPIFSWTFFGQAISYNKAHSFLAFQVYVAQFSERYCNVRFLCTSVTVSEHLASIEQFINVVSSDKYFWTIFGRQNNLDVFGHVLLAVDFGFDMI